MRYLEIDSTADEVVIIDAYDVAHSLHEIRLHEHDLRNYAHTMSGEYAWQVLATHRELVKEMRAALADAKEKFGPNPSIGAVRWLTDRSRRLRAYETNLDAYEQELASFRKPSWARLEAS